jgi:hypothetical protein
MMMTNFIHSSKNELIPVFGINGCVDHIRGNLWLVSKVKLVKGVGFIATPDRIVEGELWETFEKDGEQ